MFVLPNLGALASPWLQGPEEGSSDEEALAETRLEARPGFCPYVWLGGGGGVGGLYVGLGEVYVFKTTSK